MQLKYNFNFPVNGSDHSEESEITSGFFIYYLIPLELALLILSAFFHDIGMCPAEDDVAAFKKTIGNYHQDETSSQQRLADWIRTSHAARSELSGK
ncbi:MAG: hypothetical protein QHH75_15230 [Bacillota bacterium]|nr:hypothetical protein [Bacillota bacterium]